MKMTLKAIRVNLGLTQKEASRIIGVSEGTLNNYENYKSLPTVDLAYKICNSYGIDINNVIFLPQDCNLIAK